MRILIAEDQRDLNKILAKKLTAEDTRSMPALTAGKPSLSFPQVHTTGLFST